MSLSEHIGSISLNISFILYLCVYLPQIMHNRDNNHLKQLSPWMHYLFFTAFFLDLLYGFAKDLQWQYKTVSVVSLGLLIIQHWQLTCLYYREKKRSLVLTNSIVFLLCVMIISYFFLYQRMSLSYITILIIGYSSRVFFLTYSLPQIFKNKRLQSSEGISIKFVYLTLLLTLLDIISSWCLDWGWPNKLSGPLMFVLTGVLLLQIRFYRKASVRYKG